MGCPERYEWESRQEMNYNEKREELYWLFILALFVFVCAFIFFAPFFVGE